MSSIGIYRNRSFLILLSLISSSCIHAQDPNLLPIRNTDKMIEIGFEQPDLLNNGLNFYGNPPQLVGNQSPVFEGNQSLSVFIDKNTSYASGVTLRQDQYGKPFTEFEYGKEYWIGFAVYLNDDYQMPLHSDHLFGVLSRPDSHLGEWHHNPLTFSISGVNENRKRGINEPHWVISINGDDRHVLPNTGSSYQTSTSAALSPIAGDTGRWVSWVFHFKHTYDADGFMDIWKDGVQVYSNNGIRTAFNDDRGPFVKMGSTKWSWKSKNNYPTIQPAKRQSYLDALRIAQGADRFNDVAPVRTTENIDNSAQITTVNQNFNATESVEEVVVAEQPVAEAIVTEEPEPVVEAIVTEEPAIEPIVVEEVVTEEIAVTQAARAPAPTRSSRSTRNPKDLIEIGFEQQNLVSNGVIASGNTPTIVSGRAPVFEGNRSLSVLVDKNKSRISYRTEVVLSRSEFGKKFTEFEIGKEYWVGLAIYLPNDYQAPKYNDILLQIHSRPDSGDTPSRNPSITLSVSGELENRRRGVNESHWAISVAGDDRKILRDQNYQSNIGDVLTPIKSDKGRWVKWVIHFKNTYRSDGFIEIWKDGAQVYNKRGIRTTFNDDRGGYLKMGSYKWSWRPKHSYQTINPARRQSYLDAVRIGIGQNRYNDVAP